MESKSRANLYTLGHSRHTIETFVALLNRHLITRVVDVRGQPYSRYNPQFNREQFAKSLNAKEIDYTWSGEHLSGRPREARFYSSGGEVLWDKLMAKPELQDALDALAADARIHQIALVCAEENPMRCHRRFLLTPPLLRRGVNVLHLRGDGRVEAESELLQPGSASDGPGQKSLF